MLELERNVDVHACEIKLVDFDIAHKECSGQCDFKTFQPHAPKFLTTWSRVLGLLKD